MREVTSITFLSPVYNERDSLRELTERCRTQAEVLGVPFRMLFIDDGSNDGSREMLRELAASIPGVRVVFLRGHFGKSAALDAGFQEIDDGLVVTLDSDLQDQPEELPRLIEAYRNGADLVSGWKVSRRDSVIRRTCSRFFNLGASLFASQRFHDANSGLKLYPVSLARELVLDGDRHRFIMLLARWKGYKVAEIPVKHAARRFGKSKYGPLRALWSFFDLCAIVMLEKFRNRPIHFFGGIGAALFVSGFLLFAILIIMRLMNLAYVTNRPAYYFAILLMILGVNFFTTGMLAELLIAQMRGIKPDYVAERLGDQDKKS